MYYLIGNTEGSITIKKGNPDGERKQIMGINSFPNDKVKYFEITVLHSQNKFIEIGIGCESIRKNKISNPKTH